MTLNDSELQGGWARLPEKATIYLNGNILMATAEDDLWLDAEQFCGNWAAWAAGCCGQLAVEKVKVRDGFPFPKR